MDKKNNFKTYYVTEENMFQLKEGDILLFRPYKKLYTKNILSSIIMKITEEPWSHVGIVSKNSLIIDSDWFGVTEHDLLYNDNYVENFEYAAFRLKDKNIISNFMKAVRSKIGDAYDFPQLLLMGLFNYLEKRLNIKGLRRIKNSWDSKNKFVCSELLADCLFEAGLNVAYYTNVDKSQFAPSDVGKLTKVIQPLELE